MNMRRLFSLLLCFILLTGVLSGCENTSAGSSSADNSVTNGSVASESLPASSDQDPEIKLAISYGIVPEEIQSDYNTPITFQQYTEMLTRVIALWNEDLSGKWADITTHAAKSNEEMRREDGILEMAYALTLVGHIEPATFSDGDVDIIQPTIDAEAAPSWQYPLFPTWENTAFPLFDSNYMWGGLQMCAIHQSLSSSNAIYPFEPNGDGEYLQKPLSRGDAIRAVLRFGETDPTVFEPEGVYVDINEAGTYDNSIITDALLNTFSDLPDATQDKLPSEWQGVGLSLGKDMRFDITDYKKFRQSDLIFLSENGFNFARIFFSLSTLRFPDFPSDSRLINENELKELDQLIAWGIEYGVHIQISSSFYLDANGNNKTDGSMPANDEEWALYRDYWSMLTHRYAGISNRFLSFDLSNEVQPDEDSDISSDVDGVACVISAIREQDADRVLLYSYMGNPNMEWMEAMAQLGLAIGCHPYYPQYLTTSDHIYAEQNPYAIPAWPQLWFPRTQFNCGQSPLVLQGAVEGTTISIHVSCVEGDGGGLAAYADGNEIASVFIDNDNQQPAELFTFTVPEGIQKVELWVTDEGNHYADADTLIIESDSKKTVLVPHDVYDYPDWSEPLPLIINEDGTVTNTEDLWIDADAVYNHEIAPMKEIADRYGVGFMINEFGVFAVDVNWDIDIIARYHDDMTAMLKAHELPWVYCELYNTIPKHIATMRGEDSQWTGATMTQLTYGDTTYTVCKELLDVFCKYTRPNKTE